MDTEARQGILRRWDIGNILVYDDSGFIKWYFVVGDQFLICTDMFHDAWHTQLTAGVFGNDAVVAGTEFDGDDQYAVKPATVTLTTSSARIQTWKMKILWFPPLRELLYGTLRYDIHRELLYGTLRYDIHLLPFSISSPLSVLSLLSLLSSLYATTESILPIFLIGFCRTFPRKVIASLCSLGDSGCVVSVLEEVNDYRH